MYINYFRQWLVFDTWMNKITITTKQCDCIGANYVETWFIAIKISRYLSIRMCAHLNRILRTKQSNQWGKKIECHNTPTIAYDESFCLTTHTLQILYIIYIIINKNNKIHSLSALQRCEFHLATCFFLWFLLSFLVYGYYILTKYFDVMKSNKIFTEALSFSLHRTIYQIIYAFIMWTLALITLEVKINLQTHKTAW